jgi:hypothetical protein
LGTCQRLGVLVGICSWAASVVDDGVLAWALAALVAPVLGCAWLHVVWVVHKAHTHNRV